MVSKYPGSRLTLLESKPAGELLIHEIYQSIQGESTFAGLPCVFVRTAVCGQRCVWCDTPHAFTQGQPLGADEVFQRVIDFDCPLVELTGGEPLLQAEVLPLMSRLADVGKTVLIETSGAEDIGPIDPRVHIIMDLKCPDSGECHSNRYENLPLLKPTDQIKFVLASQGDFAWALEQITQYDLDRKHIVLMSAVFGKLNLADLVQWILESKRQIRMQLQMHKFIWDPKARGV